MQCHIIVAVMKMLNMKSLDAIPSTQYAPDGINTWMLPDGDREKLLTKITDDFVASYATTPLMTLPPTVTWYICMQNKSSVLDASTWNFKMR